MTTAPIKNWLIYAWEYPAEDKFEKKNGKFERTPLFANDVINIPGVADEATRYNLLNHIRSQEELTTQLLCWLLNNNRRFQEDFFYELCNSVSYADAHIEAEKEFDNDGAKGTYDISLIDQNGRIICIVENKIEASFNDPDKRFRMDLHNGGCIGDSKDPQLPKYLASLCAKRNSASTSMTMVILSKYDVTKEEQFMWLKKHAQQNGIIINCIAWHDVVALLDKCLASNNATVEKEISEFLHWIHLDVSEYHKPREKSYRDELIQHIEECIKKNSKGRFSFKSSYPNAISRVNHITVWHPEKRQKVEGKGAASIKYWPSLIILCKGYWVNGARHNDPPLYSVRCGLQYVENGTYWSTKHMADINIDVVFHQIENQQWQDNLAPVLEYPSLECTSLDDFWEKLDHLIGKAVATFTLFLKEKYGLDV